MDMWSLGCVFAEILLLMQSKNKGLYEHKLSDVILFPGKSCYPFTEGKGAKDNNEVTVKNDDQLIKILELVGI